MRQSRKFFGCGVRKPIFWFQLCLELFFVTSVPQLLGGTLTGSVEKEHRVLWLRR